MDTLQDLKKCDNIIIKHIILFYHIFDQRKVSLFKYDRDRTRVRRTFFLKTKMSVSYPKCNT
jgi:hypothetical protein